MKAPSENGGRFRQQQATGGCIQNDRSNGRGPALHHISPGTNTYTTTSSTHPNAANATVIHTYITLPSRDETKSPGRRIRKQPSSNLATQRGGQGGGAVHIQNRDVGHGAESYTSSEYSYGGRAYTRTTPEHFRTHDGNAYRAYPGPSSSQGSTSSSMKRVHNKAAGNHKKEKNGVKFLGIFKMG